MGIKSDGFWSHNFLEAPKLDGDYWNQLFASWNANPLVFKHVLERERLHFGLKLMAHTAFLAGLRSWLMRNSRRQWRWLWVDSFFFFLNTNSPQKRWWDLKKTTIFPPPKNRYSKSLLAPLRGGGTKNWYLLVPVTDGKQIHLHMSSCHLLQVGPQRRRILILLRDVGFPQILGKFRTKPPMKKRGVCWVFGALEGRKVWYPYQFGRFQDCWCEDIPLWLTTFAYMLGTCICWSGGYRGYQRLNAKCHPVVLRGSLKRQIFVFTVSRYFYLSCGEYDGMWPLAADDEEDGQDDDIDDDMRTILLLMTCCCSGWL